MSCFQPSTPWGGSQVQNILLQIAWNMQICTENPVSQASTAWVVLGMEVNLPKKFFAKNWKNCPFYIEKTSFSTLHPHAGRSSSQVPKLLFLAIACNVKSSHKSNLSQSVIPLFGGWRSFNKIYFARNGIKFPDLHRKLTFPNPPSP